MWKLECMCMAACAAWVCVCVGCVLDVIWVCTLGDSGGASPGCVGLLLLWSVAGCNAYLLPVTPPRTRPSAATFEAAPDATSAVYAGPCGVHAASRSTPQHPVLAAAASCMDDTRQESIHCNRGA